LIANKVEVEIKILPKNFFLALTYDSFTFPFSFFLLPFVFFLFLFCPFDQLRTCFYVLDLKAPGKGLNSLMAMQFYRYNVPEGMTE
jgi:hypothetical protein